MTRPQTPEGPRPHAERLVDHTPPWQAFRQLQQTADRAVVDLGLERLSSGRPGVERPNARRGEGMSEDPQLLAAARVGNAHLGPEDWSALSAWAHGRPQQAYQALRSILDWETRAQVPDGFWQTAWQHSPDPAWRAALVAARHCPLPFVRAGLRDPALLGLASLSGSLRDLARHRALDAAALDELVMDPVVHPTVRQVLLDHPAMERQTRRRALRRILAGPGPEQRALTTPEACPVPIDREIRDATHATHQRQLSRDAAFGRAWPVATLLRPGPVAATTPASPDVRATALVARYHPDVAGLSVQMLRGGATADASLRLLLRRWTRLAPASMQHECGDAWEEGWRTGRWQVTWPEVPAVWARLLDADPEAALRAMSRHGAVLFATPGAEAQARGYRAAAARRLAHRERGVRVAALELLGLAARTARVASGPTTSGPTTSGDENGPPGPLGPARGTRRP